MWWGLEVRDWNWVYVLGPALFCAVVVFMALAQGARRLLTFLTRGVRGV